MPPPDAAIPANEPDAAAYPANSAAPPGGWGRRMRRRGFSWYYAAALCLLLAAAVTRFYALPEHTLIYDEANVVANARGDFGLLVRLTRWRDTPPLLMPLILYGVQRIDGSALAVRLPAATASVLTIALILFLLPRWGVPRWAAFLAALLATVSQPAIFHAQDARIYSVDALMATLMMGGLLAYLHSGRKVLLAVAMFLAPLVWYGLLLFGAAILATALLAPSAGAAAAKAPVPSGRNRFGNGLARLGTWLWQRIKQRKYLALPAGLFLAATLVNYMLILRYQIQRTGFGAAKDAGDYLEGYYYPGGLNPLGALDWWADHIGLVLTYQLPGLVAGAVVAAFGLVLLVSLRRRQGDAVTILVLFSLGVAVLATLLGGYPLGDLRQCLYLGPIIFLTAGLCLYRVADNPLFRRWRGGTTAALLVVFAGVILFAGAAELRADNPYEETNNTTRHLDILEADVRDDDLVYIAGGAVDITQSYRPENLPNYYYGRECSFGGSSLEDCIGDITAAVRLYPEDPARLWLLVLVSGNAIEEQLQSWAAAGYAAPIANVYDDDTLLYRATADHPILTETRQFKDELRQLRASLQGETPAASGEFDFYIREQTLYYHKEPCAPADAAGWFSVDIVPVNAGDLPAERRESGIDERDFEFPWRGGVFDGQCLAVVELPAYPIDTIAVARFVGVDYVWERDIDRKPDYYRTAYRELIAGEPALNGDFAVYLQDDTLHYYKEPCAPADTEARFFLHLIPIDPADLPEERRQYGVDNRDFDFAEGGVSFDGKCLISISLPDYPFTEVRTGQFILGGDNLWGGAFPVEQTDYYRAAYPAIAAGVPAARSIFDLYREGGLLHYRKEPCSPADTEARFFLHVVPEEAANLPPERREHGSLNLDFDFSERGAVFDGKCLAIVPLPDYPLVEIRTGQFTAAGRLWEEAFSGEP